MALLAAVAVGPLVAPRWWHSNRNKGLVAAAASLPVVLYLGAALGEPGRLALEEKARDYVSFVVVITALYVISGGVHLEGSLSGTPLGNTALLGAFNLWDQWALDREERERPGSQLEQVMVHEPLRLRGGVSIAALGGVVLTILAAGKAAAEGRPWAAGKQEAILAAFALTAYFGTSR